MKVVIAKVDEVLFEGEARSLTVPGSEGEMTVLARHMPLITTLREGTIVVREPNEQEHTFRITSGILEVNPQSATVIL